jgi:hypothetical protein
MYLNFHLVNVVMYSDIYKDIKENEMLGPG